MKHECARVMVRERHAVMQYERQSRRFDLAYAHDVWISKQEEESTLGAMSLVKDTWVVLAYLGSRFQCLRVEIERARKAKVTITLKKRTTNDVFIHHKMQPILSLIRHRKAIRLWRWFRVRAPIICFAMRLQRRRRAIEIVKCFIRRKANQVYLVFVHAMKAFRRKVLCVQRSIRKLLLRRRTFLITVFQDCLELESSSGPTTQMIELDNKVPRAIFFECVLAFYALQVHNLRFEIRAWVKELKRFSVFRKTVEARAKAGQKSAALKEPSRPLMRIKFEERTLRSILDDARTAALGALETHRTMLKANGCNQMKISEELIIFKRELFKARLPDVVSSCTNNNKRKSFKK